MRTLVESLKRLYDAGRITEAQIDRTSILTETEKGYILQKDNE